MWERENTCLKAFEKYWDKLDLWVKFPEKNKRWDIILQSLVTSGHLHILHMRQDAGDQSAWSEWLPLKGSKIDYVIGSFQGLEKWKLEICETRVLVLRREGSVQDMTCTICCFSSKVIYYILQLHRARG